MISKKLLLCMFTISTGHLCAMEQKVHEIEKELQEIHHMLDDHKKDEAYIAFNKALGQINDLKYQYEQDATDPIDIQTIKGLLQKAKDFFSRQETTPWGASYGTIQRLEQEFKGSEKIRASHKKIAALKSAVPLGNILLHNVTIINSAEDEEWNSPLVSTLGASIMQEAAPLIIHPRLLYGLLEREKHGREAEKKILETLHTHWRIYGVIRESEDEKEWGRFLVLVPIAYQEALAKEFPTLKRGQLLGFNMLGLTILSVDFFKKNTLSYDELHAPASITDWFLPKDHDVPYALWNICLFGHGNVSVRGDQQAAALEDKKYLEDLQSLFRHRKYNELFDTRTFHASIASLTVEEFKTFLDTIQQKMRVNFLTYVSCLSGGYNLYLPYVARILNEEGNVIAGTVEPNFTVVVGSSTDAVAQTKSGNTMCLVEINKLPPGCTNFYMFFDLLNLYTKNYVKDRPVQPARFSENELRAIMQPLLDLPKGTSLFERINNMPLVMYPGSEDFIFLSLEPASTYVLTQAKIKAAEVEGKPITTAQMFKELKAKTTHAILMPVADVPITLDISGSDEVDAPYIQSLLPGIGMHVIKEINAQNNKRNFLDHFLLGSNEFPKYFFIKMLHTHETLFEQGARKKGKAVTLFDVLVGVKKDERFMLYTDAQHQIFSKSQYAEIRNLKMVNNNNTMEDVVLQYLNNAAPKLNEKEQKLFNPLKILFNRYVYKPKFKNILHAIAQEDVETVQKLVATIPDILKKESAFLLTAVWRNAAERAKRATDEASIAQQEMPIERLMTMVKAFNAAKIRENAEGDKMKQEFFIVWGNVMEMQEENSKKTPQKKELVPGDYEYFV